MVVKKTKKRRKKVAEKEPRFYTEEEMRRAVKYYEDKIRNEREASGDGQEEDHDNAD